MILLKSLCYKVCEPNSATWAAWSEGLRLLWMFSLLGVIIYEHLGFLPQLTFI